MVKGHGYLEVIGGKSKGKETTWKIRVWRTIILKWIFRKGNGVMYWIEDV